MSTPPENADDWGSPTHYESGAVLVEPRMFTEADPMTSLLGLDWDNAPEPTWGSTTYVGRRARRAKAAADGTAGGADVLEDDGVRTDAPAAEETGNRGLLANSRSMALASLISRLTGFVRSTLIVAALGLADVGNAYNSGNNFPNMVYELLLGGVLSSVLVPLLVRAQIDDDDEGVSYTQRLLSLATAALGALTLLAVLAAPLIASAFSKSDNRQLTSLFATLLLPEIFFYGLGAMFMAVLNIRHSYAAGAWSPVLNNVIMIVTVAVFWILPGPKKLTPASITNTQILVIGIGTTLGIAAQALVLIPALRRTGFRWKWRFRALPSEQGRMREVSKLAGWVLAYVISSQIGVSVIQYVGSHNNGFSVFTQADLLFQMPYGILVVSLLTAIMPRLSRAAARDDIDAVVADLSLGARLSSIALIPVTVGLIVLGSPLGVTLFAYGQAKTSSAHLVGTSLAWSAFGLVPFALVMLQLRVFYAMRDGRTPTMINIGMVATKVALVIATYQIYGDAARGVEWLNIATSVSYVVGAIIGHVLLTRRVGRLGFGRVARTAGLVLVASAVGGAVAWVIVHASRAHFGQGHVSALVGLVGGGLVGGIVMVAIIWRMRLPDVQELTSGLRR